MTSVNYKLSQASVEKVLALSIMVYETFGFVRSNQGYYKELEDGTLVKINDSKTELLGFIDQDVEPSAEHIKLANEILEKFNQRYMVKKLSGGLTSFEENVNYHFLQTN